MKEKLNNKVYCVRIGLLHESEDEIDDTENFSSETLIAPDALTAASKVKLGKNQYVSEISLVTTLTL